MWACVCVCVCACGRVVCVCVRVCTRARFSRYLSFRSKTQANLLSNFGDDDALATLMRALYVLTMVLTCVTVRHGATNPFSIADIFFRVCKIPAWLVSAVPCLSSPLCLPSPLCLSRHPPFPPLPSHAVLCASPQCQGTRSASSSAGKCCTGSARPSTQPPVGCATCAMSQTADTAPTPSQSFSGIPKRKRNALEQHTRNLRSTPTHFGHLHTLFPRWVVSARCSWQCAKLIWAFAVAFASAFAARWASCCSRTTSAW